MLSFSYHSFLLLIFLITIIHTVYSTIRVISPKALVKLASTSYTNYLDAYTVAGFGYIPYGRTLLGNIQIADPIKACSPLNLTNTNNYDDNETIDNFLIVLADRGGCHFVQKAHYAQLAGAKMLIINDNKDDDDLTKVYMGDDGQGQEITIPVIMIYKKLGDKFKAFSKNDTVIISIFFEMPKLEHTVEYEIWLSSSTNKSITFLRELKSYVDVIDDDRLKFTPHYGIFSSSNKNDKNCICEGRYCAPDPDGEGPLTGKDVIEEDIRQLVLYKKYSIDTWWSYIENVDIDCLNKAELYTCSMDTVSKQGIDINDFKNEIESTYSQNGKENRLLKQEKEKYFQRGYISFPGIVINDFTYRGNIFPASNVFEAICESFSEVPQECTNYFQFGEPKLPQKNTPFKYILISCIMCMIIAGFFLFYCYKNHLKRQITRELALKANAAVSEYFALHEGSEKDTKRLIEMNAN